VPAAAGSPLVEGQGRTADSKLAIAGWLDAHGLAGAKPGLIMRRDRNRDLVLGRDLRHACTLRVKAYGSRARRPQARLLLSVGPALGRSTVTLISGWCGTVLLGGGVPLMTGKTHALIGAAVAAPIALSLGTAPPPPPIGLAQFGLSSNLLAEAGLGALGVFAALLPDCDHPGSMLGRQFHVPLEHRGPVHSFFATAVWTGLAALAAWKWVPWLLLPIVMVTAFAYLSHLAADLTNPSPMALLWPFVRDKVRPGWLPALREHSLGGAVLEAMVTVAIVGLFGWKLATAFNHRCLVC